jgi:hypothetical protein
VRKIRFVFACLGIVVGLIAATPSHAVTNAHSFVSANGSGTTCTFTAPCLDFQNALTATAPNGIISCMDQGALSSGLFSATVTQSVTIDCAGTAVASWHITINGAGIVVTLRNLNIEGLTFPAGAGGIDFQNGAALFVEHCVIENFNSSGHDIGINFAPTSGQAKLHITDSVIKNNSLGGIFVVPSGGASAKVVIERSQIENNAYGIIANATGGLALVEVRDSTVANNSANGIWSFTGGSIASIIVDHSSSLYNGGIGIYALGTSAFVTLTDSTVVGNATGLATASAGAIGSYGNNRVSGNLSDGVTPTSIALK